MIRIKQVTLQYFPTNNSPNNENGGNTGNNVYDRTNIIPINANANMNTESKLNYRYNNEFDIKFCAYSLYS